MSNETSELRFARFRSTYPFREGSLEINTNFFLTNHLHPMMKWSYPDGSGLLSDPAPTHSEWFKYVNDKIIML